VKIDPPWGIKIGMIISFLRLGLLSFLRQTDERKLLGDILQDVLVII
jgi:hypothetical protein